jgi:hypothetical protein
MLYVCPHCGTYTEFRGIRVHPDELTCDCGGALEPAECEIEITPAGLAELEMALDIACLEEDCA